MSASADCPRRRRPVRSRVSLMLAVGLALVSSLDARGDEVAGDPHEVLTKLDADLRVTGMTFVGSRGDVSEFVLRARRAVFRPESKVAVLEDVRVTASDEADDLIFDVSCERGELDVEKNDFLAEGNVRGTTGDGRSYTAPWVRYDHERALLYTDAPVMMEDETGSFRGDGFRYHLKEQRFRLLGNVSVVHVP